METVFNEFVLTNGQQIAIEKLEWFLTSSERIFRLTGRAGRGKTYVIGRALEKYLEIDRNSLSNSKRDDIATPNVMGIAMAHKAKNNLQETGRIPYVNTFAAAYGHREKFLDNGERVFVPIKDKMQYADCKKPIVVFVFDEFSMFSRKMVNLILKETTMFAKLIFMGDRGQLPPIIEAGEADYGQDSPLFDMELPEKCSHELTENVRQTDGNPIMEMSDLVYDQIFKNPDWSDFNMILKYLSKDNLDSNGKGYQRTNYNAFYDQYRSVSDNYLDTKVIAYRNRAIKLYNEQLRNYIHDSPTEIFIPKEIVYMNKTFYGKEEYGGNYAFYNSSEYIIEAVNDGEIDGIPVIYAFVGGNKPMPVLNGYTAQELFKHRVAEYTTKRDWKGKYAFMDQFGDFSYGYALTAYRAQGSTYKNVFIDVNDIATLEVISIKRRLQSLYTAITRASDNVYFIGK